MALLLVLVGLLLGVLLMLLLLWVLLQLLLLLLDPWLLHVMRFLMQASR